VARIFISYDGKDREIARTIEKGLLSEGHQSVWGVDELVAGKGWGELMPRRLAEADAVVALLTENSQTTPSVWCEIGAARVLGRSPKQVALLPVVVGLTATPPNLGDILKLWSKTTEKQELQRLIQEIGSAINAHLETLRNEASRASYPMIFVSHRHKDQKIAEALADMLTSALDIGQVDIRCTSVQPYRLRFGLNTGDRLREEIKHAKAVLGILSPDTLESSYVMFELGAAWAQNIYTCPLLARGANTADIPSPIHDLAPAQLWVDSDAQQLLDNLEAELNLKRKPGSSPQVTQKINKLVEVSRPMPALGATATSA